jgi:hypothetical protein
VLIKVDPWIGRQGQGLRLNLNVALETGGFMVGDGLIDTLAVPTSFLRGSASTGCGKT